MTDGFLDNLSKPEQTPTGFLDNLSPPSGIAATGFLDDLAPQQETGTVFGDIGRALYDIPVQLKGAVAGALEGTQPFAEQDWKDIAIQEAQQRSKERAALPGGEESLLGISRQDIRELPQNLGFSLTSAGAGLTAGIPASVATPLAGWAAGGAASGVAAYRMDTNQFIRQIRSSMEEAAGRPVTEEEWKAVEPRILDAAERHGMYEAIPEAIGNVAGLKIITKPLTGILGKNVVTRVAGKLAGLFGTELATETVTQMGQQKVEAQIGLTDQPERSWTSGEDWWKSLKEVAPQTFLLTAVMGTAGMVGHKTYQAIKGTPKETDVIKDAATEGKLNLIPNSEYERVLNAAETALTENPNDETLLKAVEVYRAEQERRAADTATVQKGEAGTMTPTAAPEMETELTPEVLPSKLAMEPGSQYKGMISDQETVLRSQTAPPTTAVQESAFRGKEDLVRRDQILTKFAKAVGTKLYQGRIRKGKRELGFHVPKTEETRTKKRNDIEVAAHEIAHLIDYRGNTFKKGYHQKEYKEEVRSLSYDKTKLYEGFAEFVRHWMTNKEFAKEKAPKFTAWFEKTLETHPHGEAIRTAQMEMHAWYEQGLLKQAQSKIGQGQITARDRFNRLKDRWLDRFIAGTLDAWHGFKRAEQDLLGKTAKDLPAYMAVRLLAGNRMLIRAVYERGTVNWRPNGDLYFTGTGLREVFSEVMENLDLAMTYFAGRRAKELMSQGREQNFSRGQVQAMLDLEIEHPEFKRAFEKWQSFNQRMLDFAQTSGVISGETREKLDEMGRDYVPFYRIIEEVTGEKLATGKKFMKRLTGGTGNVNDVFENITTNVQLLIDASMKNMAKQQIYNLVGHVKGGANYAAKIPTEIKTTWIDKKQIVDALKKAEVEIDPDNLEDVMTFFTFGHPPKGKNIDVVFYQGKPVYYEIADPLFLRSVQAFGTKPLALGLRVLGGAKTLLTRMVTMSFDFMYVNGIRDTLSAFLLSKSGFKPGLDSVRGFKSRLLQDNAYWEAMINGVGMSTFAHGESQQLRYQMEKFYTEKGIDINTVLDTPARLLDAWDELASATEYAARLQEYKNLRAKGVSARKAAFAGREVSTDFALRGDSEFVRLFTATVPFLGARLQGLYRLGRAVAPGKLGAYGEGESALRLATKATIGLVLPSMALYALNHDDERYKRLPDWVRDLHWVILIPGSERVYLIPKPFEFGAFFGSMPERMMEYAETENGTKFVKAMGWILQNQLEMGITPQIIKPTLDVLMNKKWTGSPIVPEDLKDVEAFAQYRPWTSDTMVAMGKALDMSPLKLEALMQGYFGTIGSYVMMISDSWFRAASGNPAPTKRLDEYPVLRRMMRDAPLRYTQYQDDFYEMSKEVSTVVNTYALFMKDGRVKELLEYMQEGKAKPKEGETTPIPLTRRESLFGVSKTVDQMKALAGTINRQLRVIQLDPNLSSDEKRRRMDNVLREQESLYRQSVRDIEPALRR